MIYYKSVVQRVLNLAYKRGMISEVPIHDFDITREFRNRVWRGDENLRFNNMIQKYDSHLKWVCKLSEYHPIRKMDISPLTDENLILTGRNAPYIRFRPKKTGKRKPRDTYLPLLDLRVHSKITSALMRHYNITFIQSSIAKSSE